jgi:NAD(P)-dependent dehydrogenase (short-subunit alcohol dehydrogenase family)
MSAVETAGSDVPMTERVALVTGGGTGIGAAISRRLASLGASVAVHQRTAAKARAGVDAVREEGGNAASVVADLSSLTGCREAVDGCLEAFGRIDILINNAAVTGPTALTPILDLDDERLVNIVSVNLTAAIRCSQLAAREMGEGGVIVNIGSVASFAAQPGGAAYAATKSALVGLTRALAIDLAERGVRAVHVAPGDIATETSSGGEYEGERAAQPFHRVTPLGRRGRPEEIAAMVAFLCTDQAAFVTGSSHVVDGGWLAY